jgi:autotransporter-associated beta strand protein
VVAQNDSSAQLFGGVVTIDSGGLMTYQSDGSGLVFNNPGTGLVMNGGRIIHARHDQITCPLYLLTDVQSKSTALTQGYIGYNNNTNDNSHLVYLTTNGASAATRTIDVEDSTTLAAGVSELVIQQQIRESTGVAGSILKKGVGILELNMPGGNKYSGGTVVTGGTLVVNNTSGLGAGTGLIQVYSGATLGGTGIVAGVTMHGGTLSPGNSAGTITVSNLTLTSASTVAIELGGLAFNSFDRIVDLGTTALAGSLNVSLIGGFSPTLGDKFVILTNGLGGVSGTFSAPGNVVSDGVNSYSVGYTVNDVTLTTIVPEPATLGTVGLGALAMLMLRHSRRRKA